MEDILKIYEGTRFYNGEYTIPVTKDVTVFIDEFANIDDCLSWDSKGVMHTDKLIRTIQSVESNPHTKENKLLLILQQFRDTFMNFEAGLELTDEDIPFLPYDGSVDPFWNLLKEKYNVNINRQLIIVTYGVTFIKEIPKRCQEVFNAAIIRGKLAARSQLKKKMAKLRGTDFRLQEEIRNADLFPSFVSSMVEQIELNDLNHIAIVCRVGKHRSVACAEMLKNLYPNVRTKHLTIDN